MAMRILLPVDGSDCALAAAARLVTLAGDLRETPEIHLLNVHPPIPIGRVQAHLGKETLNAYYLEEGQAQMASAQACLAAAGLAFTPHLHVGLPAEVIARLAGELHCDLIVMGSHGRSALSGMVAGSVATRVLHLAPCPVLLVK